MFSSIVRVLRENNFYRCWSCNTKMSVNDVWFESQPNVRIKSRRKVIWIKKLSIWETHIYDLDHDLSHDSSHKNVWLESWRPMIWIMIRVMKMCDSGKKWKFKIVWFESSVTCYSNQMVLWFETSTSCDSNHDSFKHFVQSVFYLI